jgi:hypothetical protein
MTGRTRLGLLTGVMLAALGLAALAAVLLAPDSSAERDAGLLALATPSQVTSMQTPPPRPPRVNGPKPDATSLAQLTAIVGYYGNKPPPPRFEGNLNGIDFSAGQSAAACPHDFLYGTAGDHGAEVVMASGLDFTVGLVPAGYVSQIYHPMSSTETGPISVVLCKQETIGVSQDWKAGEDEIVVRRFRTQPKLAPSVERDRLDAATINGRQAVIVRPRFDWEESILYLSDDVSFWEIRASALSPEELIQFASSITTP